MFEHNCVTPFYKKKGEEDFNDVKNPKMAIKKMKSITKGTKLNKNHFFLRAMISR